MAWVSSTRSLSPLLSPLLSRPLSSSRGADEVCAARSDTSADAHSNADAPSRHEAAAGGGGGGGGGGETPRLPGFRFAEIFSGIGGFRLALEPLGGTCVLASEINPAACRAYAAHWPGDGALVGDITGVCASQMADLDLLTAG